MSGMFSNLKSDGLEETQDRIGGFNVRDTDIYLAKIKVMYAGKSQGGASSVTIVADLPDGEYTETVYITNREGENWFLNKQDNSKRVSLPGYTIINDLCLVTTGHELHEQNSWEEKVVKIYDYDERKEMPKNVMCLTDMQGTTAYLAIDKENVDKNSKNESTGEYEATGETRDQNVIVKVFHDPTKVTVVEQREALKATPPKTPEPVFFGKWQEKNKGVTRQKATKGASAGVSNGKPGSAAPSAGGNTAPKKTSSLFAKP